MVAPDLVLPGTSTKVLATRVDHPEHRERPAFGSAAHFAFLLWLWKAHRI